MTFEGGRFGRRKTERKPSAGVPESVDPREHAQMSVRILELAQRIRDGEARAFDILDMLPDNVLLQSDANPWTTAYRSLFELARTHPDLTRQFGEMADMIGQNPQMISPSDLVDIAADVAWDPRIHDFLKNGIIHSIGYALRFNDGLDYESAMAERLDFTNEEHFTDTAHFLEFTLSLYNVADTYSYADDDAVVLSRVREALTKTIDAHQGSYLLNTRAQELLAAMDGSWQLWAEGDRVPFIITGDRYAWHREDGLYVTERRRRQPAEYQCR